MMNIEIEQMSVVISKLQAAGPEEAKESINYILSLMSQKKNLSPVAGSMIKLLAVHNVQLKKVVSSYLIRYSDDIVNVNILASNNLLNDISDPNPHLRKLATKTVCSISELKEQSLHMLPQVLGDSSTCVRKAAVLCCPQLLKYECLEANPFIDLLYEMIKDCDNTVVASSLLAVNEVLTAQGGIIMNNKMIEYLINKLSTFEEWSLSPVCSIIKNYKPNCNEEVISFLNSLDDKLCERNPIVFIPVMELSLSFVHSKLEGFEKEIIEQVSVFLKLLLTSSNNETIHAVLELIEKLIPLHKELFSIEYKQFLCRFCDSPWIRVKKLLILAWIINENNCYEVCEELLSHCLDDFPEVRKQAVNSIFSVLKVSFSLGVHCVKMLIHLMDLNYTDLIEEIINSFASLNPNEITEIMEYFLLAISDHYTKILSRNSKVALLWSIGNYGKIIEKSPYILENIFNDTKSDDDENVVGALLTASVKLFFTRPVEMQLLLGQIFQSAKQHHSLLVRRQASFYLKLLKLNVNTASKVAIIDEYVSSTTLI